MSSNTTKYVIPYPQTTDTIAAEPTTVQNLANRLDLLLGEAGTFNVTGTSGSQAISLGRTYPGNVSAAVPGIVVINTSVTMGATLQFNLWVQSWTGTATTITGFTIGWAASASQSARPVLWRFLPVL